MINPIMTLTTIEQALRQMEPAWNNHDVKAFGRLFTTDADFTNVFGMSAQGRAAIEAFHAPVFQTLFKDSTLTFTRVNIRLIKTDVAAVDAFWTMSGATGPAGNPWPERQGLMNLVMEPQNRQWLISVMHNMDLPSDGARKG
jgi:uncharacterized protein (TIGR02246 family)